MKGEGFQAKTISNLFPALSDGHASREADGTYTYRGCRMADGTGVLRVMTEKPQYTPREGDDEHTN